MCLIKIPWNTKYRFEFVIPYTRSKILIPSNTTLGSQLSVWIMQVSLFSSVHILTGSTIYTNFLYAAQHLTYKVSDLLSSSVLPSSLSLIKLSMFITNPFSWSIRLMLSLKASETPASCSGCVRYCHIMTLINWSATLASSSHFCVTLQQYHNHSHFYNLKNTSSSEL